MRFYGEGVRLQGRICLLGSGLRGYEEVALTEIDIV